MWPEVDVHHLGDHEDEGLPLLGLEIDDGDRRSQPDTIGRGLVVGQRAQRGDPRVELAQPGLDELLALERGLVLGIFPQVAKFDRLGNGLGNHHVELVAQLVDFLGQLLAHFSEHGACGVRGVHNRKPRAGGASSRELGAIRN